VLHFLKLKTVISAQRTAQISVFIAFSYKNASLNGSSFFNKFHQIKVLNVKITKNGQCACCHDTVCAQTAKREHLNCGRVHDCLPFKIQILKRYSLINAVSNFKKIMILFTKVGYKPNFFHFD